MTTKFTQSDSKVRANDVAHNTEPRMLNRLWNSTVELGTFEPEAHEIFDHMP
jgi:hypothetical protein